MPAALAAQATAAWAVAASPSRVAVVAVLGAVIAGAAPLLVPTPQRSTPQRSTRQRSSTRWPSVALAAAVVATTCVAVLAASLVRDAGALPRLIDDGATVTLLGTVASAPHAVRPDPSKPWTLHERRWVVTVAARQVSGRGLRSRVRAPVLVIGGSGWDAVQRGAPIRVRGRLGPTDPGDEARAVLSGAAAPVSDGPPPPLRRPLLALRAGLVRASAPLPPDARGLLPGLVVGDTRGLRPDLSAAMRTSGLTHLTAVSGGNTAIVTGTLLALATALGTPRGARLALAALGLGAFGALAGGDPSVLRAGVMGAVALIGLASSRRGTGVQALAAAVVVLLVGDPWLSRSAGFALSTLATGSLLVLARPWAEALSRWLPRPLAVAVAVPLAAQAVCGPVVALLSPQVSLVAVPANLLVGPVVGPTTIVGLAATLVAPVWPQGAGALAQVAGLGAWWIAAVARRAAALPAAALPWPQGWAGAVALAVATVALAFAPTSLSAARRRWSR